MRRSKLPYKRAAIAKLSPFYTRISAPKLFDHVKCFCMFIGHGRSGSSLMGGLLNAHQNIVMSNELNVLEYMKANLSRTELFNLIYYMTRRQVNRGSQGGGGYSYAVPNQWQGRHGEILVLGDRKAGATAIQIHQDKEMLSELKAWIGLPIKFVHVVRNPFDTLTTTVRKTIRNHGELEEVHLRRQIERYFERASAVKTVMECNGVDNIYFVYHEDLMLDSRAVLINLCHFLGLEANDEYVQDCTSIIRREPHITRDKIVWTPALIDFVSAKMAELPWLKRYSYDE